MKEVRRRTILVFALASGALSVVGRDVSADDSSVDSAPAPTPAPRSASAAWVVNPPSFAVGSGDTFNLATTLPAGVARGGTFDISTSGARLPAGMTLTPMGILSVGTATVGSVTGVVFTYSSS